MPVGPGRFRVKTMPSGKKVRLHFTPGGTVNEAKSLSTGATHSPEAFAADRAQVEPKRNSYRRRR